MAHERARAYYMLNNVSQSRHICMRAHMLGFNWARARFEVLIVIYRDDDMCGGAYRTHIYCSSSNDSISHLIINSVYIYIYGIYILMPRRRRGTVYVSLHLPGGGGGGSSSQCERRRACNWRFHLNGMVMVLCTAPLGKCQSRDGSWPVRQVGSKPI